MKIVNQETKDISIKSLESTYKKLSNAYKSMTEKGTNTTLIRKRKSAVRIGLDSLDGTWNGKGFPHEVEAILISKEVLQGLIPSIEKQIAKAKEGSPQKTLNERRLIAFKLAIESLENRLK